MPYRQSSPISPELAKELFRISERYRAADDISLKVGYVLGPLLFFGTGALFCFLLPAPYHLWVGLPFFASGGLFVLGLLAYARRGRGPAYAALALAERTLRAVGPHGATKRSARLRIRFACTIHEHGIGRTITRWNDKTVTRVLTSAKLEGALVSGASVVTLFMPTHQVVAVVVDGKPTCA